MEQLDDHARAQQVFAEVLAKVTQDQRRAPTPCGDWDVAALLDHVIGGNFRVAAYGGTPQPDAGPSEPAADAADLVGLHAASAAAACGAFAAPEGLSRSYRLPFGEVPGSAFVGMRTTDLFTHAWDLARATGQSTELDPALATKLLETSRARISPGFRGADKPFAEEQPCPDDATAADRLAAFLGRRVA